MIKKFFFIFLLINFFNFCHASVESEIISNFNKINNISFDFKQTINDKKFINKKIKKRVSN